MSGNRFPVVHIYPRGTYRAPAFYFRGAEPLMEPEHLAKQLSVARSEYRRSKRELEKEQAEYEQVTAELSKKETYTVALASALGDESGATGENARLRREIEEVTAKIDEVEHSINYFKQQQNQAFIAGLHKERACYQTELENLKVDVMRGIEEIQTGKVGLGQTVCCEEFGDALQRGAESTAVRQLQGYLRGKMNRLFNSFSSTRPPKNVTKSATPASVNRVKALLEEKQDLVMKIDQLQNEKFYTEALARASALAMIDQIESMNRVLVAFGGDPVDCEELRGHFKPAEKKTEESEAGDERPKTKQATRTSGGLPTKRRPKTSGEK